MKKSFISLGLIVAATFALTNCAKELENPSQQPESAGIPFEITASTPDTKTANDDFNTVWVADDALSVFHVETGATEFVENDQFTITSENLAANKFTGELKVTPEAGKSYDWYVMYPYKSSWKPNTTGAGVVYMGSKYNAVQTQNGNDSKAHLAGGDVPFAGKAINVAASSDVNITMEHLAAVLEITVNNTSGENLTVSSVTFTAPEPIIGGYYISIVGAEPVYTKNGIYVNETATLNVKNATPIASGSSAKYYLAIKPFDATSGTELKISVNGYEKTLALPKDVSFEAGKIKPLKFTYNKIVGQAIPYTEAFNNTQGLFTIENKTLPTELTYVWKENSGYIKASAFKSDINYESESWLISPYLDLTEAESAYMSFEHCGNYFTSAASMKEDVKVKVRKHGGDWADLAIEYPTSLGWNFVHSGFVSLASYLGNNVQVAFVYTSTASKSGTWEVRNFKVDIKKDQFLSFSANEVEAKIGEAFDDAPVLNGAKTTVTYTSSNPEVATVNESTGEVTLKTSGETTITAAAAETSEYFEATTTYILTVKAAGDMSKTATLQPKSITENTTIADDAGNSWSITSDGSYNSSKSYIQVGTNSKEVSYLTVKTSEYSSKKVKSITVFATSKANTNVTTKISIGANLLGTSGVYTLQNAAAGGTEFTVENTTSASGDIDITISRPSSATGAIYFVKAEVVYED